MKASDESSKECREGDTPNARTTNRDRGGRNGQESVDGGGERTMNRPSRSVASIDSKKPSKERGLRGRRVSHRTSMPTTRLRQVLLRRQRSQPLTGAEKEAKRQACHPSRTSITAGSVRQDQAQHRKKSLSRNLFSLRTQRSQHLTGADKETKRRGSQLQATSPNIITTSSALQGSTKENRRHSKLAFLSRKDTQDLDYLRGLVDRTTADHHDALDDGNNSEGATRFPFVRETPSSVLQSSPARVAFVTEGVRQQTVNAATPVVIPSSWPSANFVEATPINDDTPSEIGEAELVPSEELERKVIRAQKARECRRIGYGIIMICIIVTTSVLGFGRNDAVPATSSPVFTAVPTLSPTSIPTTSPSQVPSFHIADMTVDSLTQVQDVSSPQAQAHQWLSNHTNITNMPQWRRSQLFALATFYYTFGGPNWRDDVKGHWMKDALAECDWFSLEFGTFFPISGKFMEVANASRASICDPSGRYTVLWPPKNLWVDPRPFPQELALLTALKKIDIVNNPINSSVTEIENLSNLEHLTLDFASLVGTVRW